MVLVDSRHRAAHPAYADKLIAVIRGRNLARYDALPH